jgi:hypothetical protein
MLPERQRRFAFSPGLARSANPGLSEEISNPEGVLASSATLVNKPSSIAPQTFVMNCETCGANMICMG